MDTYTVSRYLYKSGGNIWIDDNGLLLGTSSDFGSLNLFDLDQIKQFPGGILLAEGGMGKTIFFKLLQDSIDDHPAYLFKLGEYRDDSEGFKAEIREAIPHSEESDQRTIILDGLDEAPKLAGIIIRLLKQFPPAISVWISSRDISAIRAVQTERPELTTYSLAPLREKDLPDLATSYGLSGVEFLKAVTKQGLLPICSKPIGCQIALLSYRGNGLNDVDQKDLWEQGIRTLCDNPTSPSRQLGSNSEFTLDQIYQCSAWIALCLTLTNMTFIWTGEQSLCPTQSLGVSDVTSNSFTSNLIRETLTRGVFSPLGDGRITYTHAFYKDYLAAVGFGQHVPANHWTSLLITDKRESVYPQREGLAAWLATWNTGFLEEMSAIQPELLIASIDSVQVIGAPKLCEALLNRSEALSYRQRRSSIIQSNLHRLKSAGTHEVLRDYLSSNTSSLQGTELAISIIESCHYSELADNLAERVLDKQNDLNERLDASHAVFRLQNENAKSMLKSLFPITPEEDPSDELRGMALRTCWPKHLTPTELITHLRKPQKANFYGTYNRFLSSELPQNLESSMDVESAVVFLNWGIPYLSTWDLFDPLVKLSRFIYSFAWKWTKEPAIVGLLADGYLNAIEKHHIPFSEEDPSSELIDFNTPTKETFKDDVEGRFKVLENILSDKNSSDDILLTISISEYPLFSKLDFPHLLELAIEDPNGPLVEAWSACIKIVINRIDMIEFAGQIDLLHKARPDLIESSQNLISANKLAQEHFTARELKWKKEQENREQERQAAQIRIDAAISKALHNPNLQDESFPAISSWLFSRDGSISLGSIDVQQSKGWSNLDVDEKDQLVRLASHYIKNRDIPPTAPNQHQYHVARALYLLKVKAPGEFDNLSEKDWKRCSIELLKVAYFDESKLLTEILDTFSDNLPNVATEAIIQLVKTELETGYISIIRVWGSRLSEKQAQVLTEYADDPSLTYRKRDVLLDEIANHGYGGLVRTYLEGVFADGWALPANHDYNNLRQLAFVLSPEAYIHQLLEAIETDSSWGKQWFESTIVSHEKKFQESLLSCQVDDIAKLYIWLHTNYPQDTRPEHEGTYSPGPLDEIHDLKTTLLNCLIYEGRFGSANLLQSISERFPADGWFVDCVKNAQLAENAKAAPILTIKELTELSKTKQSSRCLINSTQDLIDIVKRSIEEYGAWLQNDTPAVGDLWNTIAPIRPRDEEYLSDHLKRYLDIKLTSDIIINREVQIRRKLFKGGISGSRTDLWVEAIDTDTNSITLCIEIKCNWNSSSKTAMHNQLINKYMSGGTASAGILLLGWFECSKWDGTDGRLAKSTSTWSDSAQAQSDLQQQAEQERQAGNTVEAMVIDCGLR